MSEKLLLPPPKEEIEPISNRRANTGLDGRYVPFPGSYSRGGELTADNGSGLMPAAGRAAKLLNERISRSTSQLGESNTGKDSKLKPKATVAAQYMRNRQEKAA